MLITALVCSGLIFQRFNQELVRAEVVELEGETRILATRFTDPISELVRDAALLAGMPPIQGLIRAGEGGGIDPTDGSSYGLWKERLETIFEEALRQKPDYLQVRYIGAADGGRELVRVQREFTGAPIERVESPALQRKGDEPYFRAALDAPSGEVFLSRITLNREHGEIEEPHVPMARAAVPVFTPEGETYGIVVINYDIGAHVRRLNTARSDQRDFFLVNELGQYLLHPDPRRGIELGSVDWRPAWEDFPEVRDLLASGAESDSKVLEDRGAIATFRRIDLGPPTSGEALVLVASKSIEDITAVSGEVARKALLAVALSTTVALLVGLWLARYLGRPIARLTAAVEDSDPHRGRIALPADLPGEAGQLATALDVSFAAQRTQTEALRAKNSELEQFAFIASHDLQEPVRTITSFSNLLRSRYASVLDERGLKSLEFIEQSSERMSALIQGLLEYSRIGKEAEPERTDLAQLVASALEDLGSQIAESDATIEVGELPTMTVYAVGIRLLFQNLVGNAIKFRHPDRPARIEIRAQPDPEGGWRFEVSDNGIGIAPEHRERIFLIFQKLHGRDEYAGTGIGLAHCRKVVELHGGVIWVEQGRSEGTRFCFRLRDVQG